jgi:hypothetical protein
MNWARKKDSTSYSGSRAERWGAKDETPVVAALLPVQALQMSPGRERALICEGRAQAAITHYTLAYRSASDRLENCRRGRRQSTSLSVAAGLLGIASLLFIIHNPEMIPMALVFSALGAAAACAPPIHMILRIGEAASIEARTMVETEKISMLLAQAKLMGRTIVAASDEQGLSKVKHELLDMLLNDLEKASLAQRARASVPRGDTAVGQMRRDARISPTNKRVIVSIDDLTKFHVQIIDVSLSGVAVEGLLPGVGAGSDVVVGARKARVVRLFPHGAGLEFATPIPADQFDENIVL